MQSQFSYTYRSMRSSLHPFVRNPELQLDTNSSKTNVEDSCRKPKSFILERYHDQSYILDQKPLTRIQQYISVLARINRVLFFRKYGQEDKTKEESQSFNPQQNWLYIWYFTHNIYRNLFVALSIMYHLFQIPLVLFFTQRAFISEFQSAFGITCNILSLIVLLINIVYIIPNTQYYHNGFLITNQVKIIKRYLGWRLAVDCVGYVCVFVFVVAETYQLIYLKLFFHVMIYRLGKVDQAMQRKIELTKVRLAAYKLFRIIILLCYLALWLGAIFFALDYHYYVQGDSAKYTGTQLWLVTSSATNYDTDIIQFFDNWWVWVNYSFYWSIQTLSMVGFGDITPKNPVQATYVSVLISCVVICYAFFITGVWQIVAEAREFTTYQQRQWKVYKEYQKDNMKPLDRHKYASEKGTKYRQLKNKVGSYLFEMWNNEKTYSEINIVEVLEKTLTPELKDQVFINYRQHMFQRIDLFRELAEAQAKNYKYIFRDLIFKITEKKYAKNETILNHSQLNPNLVYLVSGVVTLTYPNSHYSRSFRQSASNFGIKEFFIQQAMSYSVMAQSFCKTSELSLLDFLASIRQVEDFYVKYCQLRDDLLLYNRHQLTGQECIQCGDKNHDLQLCDKCDVVMFYKKLRVKSLEDNRFRNQPLNIPQIKNTKISYRRKMIKSTKVHQVKYFSIKDHIVQSIKNYDFYHPQFNLE